MKIEIRAIKCPECGDIIYSRHNHDMMYCSCGKTFIDGGPGIKKKKSSPGIWRTNGELENILKIELEFDNIGVCEYTLFNDWNKNINKYGRITK